MGWYSEYTLKLDNSICDFDYDFVDSWCSEQENYIMVDYMRHQYKNPLEINVDIKYGKEDILCVKNMLEEKFGCNVIISVDSTDETEWPDWRTFVREQHLYV